MSPTAIIYARYSSDLSRDASIDDQLRLCRAYADRMGWTILGTFEDRAISGASTIRPGYQQMLTEVQAGRVDIVLAEALDRLSRDQEDIAALFKRLRFIGVKLETVSEGEIGDLHIGLKGAMNALYLKDLADKTRRGLEGRVRSGRSGGGLCYGYDVIDGAERGLRSINPVEAAVVGRIFESFADGRSPKAIAHDLNDHGIPGPRGALWRDTAIRGHRTRGTGILNNELYIGRLIWNRLRYIKDPKTGRRVSRQNDPSAWVIEEVPDLRIIKEALWRRVKSRQGDIDASPRVQAIKASRFWEQRRAAHLLTGRVRCMTCGGNFAAVGRDYLACSNARKLKRCDQRKGIRREHLETFILQLLRNNLMQPAAVKAFVTAYNLEVNRSRDMKAGERRKLSGDLSKVEKKLDGLYDAVSDGLRTTGILAKIEALEARQAEIQNALDVPGPSPVRLHPNLAEIYCQRVDRLRHSIEDPAIRDAALDTLRGLIDEVLVGYTEEGWIAELHGEITALVDLGVSAGDGPGCGASGDLVRSAKVVAGVGFEPTTFRL